MPETSLIICALLILALGILIGWALGTARTNASLILYYRDYYRRQADARVKRQRNFLLHQMQSFGTALEGHRRAATEAFDGGRREGFRSFIPREYTRKGDKPISHISEFRK